MQTINYEFRTKEEALEFARRLRRRKLIGPTFHIYWTKKKQWRLSVEWRGGQDETCKNR